MNCLKSQTLIIIFTIAAISVLSPCHCDNLIEATCKKTPNFDVCVRTLKSDPSSSDADVTGLALIMVKVIKEKVGAISDKINQLLKNGDLDPKQEKALRSCGETYKIAMKIIVETIEGALRTGDPKFAEDGLVNIGIDAKVCEEDFPNGTSPLTKENNALHDLADVAVAIVRLLL